MHIFEAELDKLHARILASELCTYFKGSREDIQKSPPPNSQQASKLNINAEASNPKPIVNDHTLSVIEEIEELINILPIKDEFATRTQKLNELHTQKLSRPVATSHLEQFR